MDAEAYYLRCCRTIDCNPVRAGMVADPADYRWSSHRRLAFGSERFKDQIEQALGRAARPPQRGRPRKAAASGVGRE